jgi:hypothetical protein
MLAVNPPYFLSFAADPAPTAVDHTKRDPGPPDGKRRAGYTRFVLDARITVKWEDGPTGADSMMPFFFESVNIHFFLKDFQVEISSDYRAGSCPYVVTREHEFESHVRRPTRIFYNSRDLMVARLNGIPLPTRQAPRRIAPGQGAAAETQFMSPVVVAVRDIKSQIKATLDQDRLQQDSPAAYRVVHARCPAAEWGAREL